MVEVVRIPRFILEVPVGAIQYRIDTTSLPVPFEELALLGLTTASINAIKRYGFSDIRSLSQDLVADDSVLLAKKTEDRRLYTAVTDAQDKITRFEEEIRQKSKSGEVLVINARNWFEEHDLTWAGTPKTPEMVHAQTILKEHRDERDLGMFLYEEYYQRGHTSLELAHLMQGASNNTATFSPSTLLHWVGCYKIPIHKGHIGGAKFC